MTDVASGAPSAASIVRSWLDDDGIPAGAGGARSSSARIALDSWYGSPAPGSFPFTRFRDAAGYLDDYWVMGQYSGYGTPKETNLRFRRLLDAGQTGLSIALDLPTQMGLDSDHELARGEVGRVGAPLDTVDDLLVLLEDLPLDRVRQLRTTANSIGPIFAAFVVVAFEELGVDRESLRVMLQNDPLKEYSARGTYIFPPDAGLRLAVDVVEYFASVAPHWEPIEFCGYHLRDAGATATEEVAVSAANGIAYLDEAQRRGLPIADIAHSLYVFLSAGVDIFEEAAKFRATRRLWAKLLHEVFGVPKDESAINIFAYTLGGALTAQEPMNNIVRIAYETLAAVLGGTQTLATSSFDEALGLPSQEAADLALRTQQIVAYESGATKVIDPLGGSHYVEALTEAIEQEATTILLRILEGGGAVAALESGLIASLLTESAVLYQRELESGERPVVGVSIFRAEADAVREPFRIPPELQIQQCEDLRERRELRDGAAVARALGRITASAKAKENVIPSIVEAVRLRASIGEITRAIGEADGFHRATSVRL